MAAMTQDQINAEIKRKAAAGTPLTDPTAEKQALYDSYRNATQPPATSVASATPQTQQPDMSAMYIQQLNEARRQQTLNQLAKSRDAALSNLGAEKAKIQPKYYEARRQTSAGSQQQARNFAEYMAARGGSSGAAAQAELSRMGTLQGNLGGLRQQETADFADIERRTTDVNNAYQSDLASANAGIEADRMRALLEQYNADRARELQIAGLMGSFNGQRTLQGNQFELQKDQFAWERSPDNPAVQSQIISNKINQLTLENLPQEKKVNLEILQQELATGKLNQREAEYKLKELEDPNSVYNRTQRLKLEVGQLENQELRKRIEMMGKTPPKSEYEAAMEELKLEKIQAEIDKIRSSTGNSGTNSSTAVKNAQDIINNSQFLTVPKDKLGFPISGAGKVVSDSQGLSDFIFSLNLPEAETRQLHQIYGLKWGG